MGLVFTQVIIYHPLYIAGKIFVKGGPQAVNVFVVINPHVNVVMPVKAGT